MSTEPTAQLTKLKGSSLRRKFIRTMLIVSSLIGGVTLAIVLFLSTRASAHHLREIEASIEEGITSKGKVLTENHALALHGMILDNAFLDMQTLLARAVSQDPDLVYGLFVNTEGEALAFQVRGAATEAQAAPAKDAWQRLGLNQGELVTRKEMVKRVVRLGEEVVEVAEPVFGEDREILGTLRYGLSTRRMHQAIAAAATESKAQQLNSVALIGVTVGLATLLGILISRMQAVRITQPVQALTQAAIDLAAGQRSVRVAITSGDELEVLGTSFNRMVEELSTSYRELEEMNRTLEQKVAERTLALAGRNRDMRLVLDNVDQGFVTLSPDGMMASERSAVVDRWFGSGGEPSTLWGYLNRVAPEFALSFEMGWDQLVADVLPAEVALEQLPSRLTCNGCTFDFRYLPFLREERVEGVLVVVADITAKLLREREEAELTELMQVFRRLMLDKSGFAAFFAEASEMTYAILSTTEGSSSTLSHTLHTLKGNAAQMGLGVVARLCHTLEDELAAGDGMQAGTLTLLRERWAALTEHVLQLLGDGERHSIEVSQRDYTALVRLLSRDGQSRALSELLSWRSEPAARPLGRLAEQAQQLAKRLGKGELEVEVRAGALRLDPETYGPFYADLVHLVRNAVDHGIERPEQRAELGKPRHGKMLFEARTSEKSLIFELSDDGRGIDWTNIERRGALLGLPCRNTSERLAVLCREGVSTRSEVSETSGRGVGMSAFAHRVSALHGRLEVESTPGAGTKWTITLPWSPEEASERLRSAEAHAAAG